MEVIPIAECVKIGHIQKLHGIHGELVLSFETKFDESIEAADVFFLELEGLLVPFFLEEDGLRIRSAATANIKFQWVDSEKGAKTLIGTSVYLKTSDIIKNHSDFTIDEYLNFLLEDISLGEIGPIIEINNYGGNIVFTVDSHSREILVPFNKELLKSADIKNKRLILSLPPGLLDLTD